MALAGCRVQIAPLVLQTPDGIVSLHTSRASKSVQVDTGPKGHSLVYIAAELMNTCMDFSEEDHKKPQRTTDKDHAESNTCEPYVWVKTRGSPGFRPPVLKKSEFANQLKQDRTRDVDGQTAAKSVFTFAATYQDFSRLIQSGRREFKVDADETCKGKQVCI